MTMLVNSVLAIDQVSYQYNQLAVLKDITLKVPKGQTVAIVGTSGVGKTTLFNLIAGHLTLQTGSITIDGSPEIKGQISYMLQKDMLFQHKTVIENIMLPLMIKGVHRQAAQKEAAALLAQFKLLEWANYYPSALSGGMRQRVAFLRTACFKREWVLLDEAFGALDAVTRRQMYQWFGQYKQLMGWSTLLITHDVEEALILSDVVYVIGGKPGQILLELPVNMQKNNFEALVFEPQFLDYKRQLLKVLSQ